MNVIILSVGDELVLGQTVDTNSAWISQQLANVGIGVHSHKTVGDAQADIEAAIRSSVSDCDALIVSGGIGPTDDDVTRQALAAVMNVELLTDVRWLDHLRDWFGKLGRVMPEGNTIQATYPAGTQIIWNRHGTAAGVKGLLEDRFDRTRPARQIPVFLMPGVPKEMKAMFTADVLPALAAAGGGAAIIQRTLHTFGAGESTVAEKLGALMKRGRNPSVGTTVAGGVVSVRVNARFDTVEETRAQSDATCAQVRAALGHLIYGEDGTSLHAVVSQLLKQENATLATAESCTGGLLAKYMTDLPGSSATFTQGWITYSNQSKTDALGVPTELFETEGAVSEPVAVAMANGARQRSTFGIGITGVAGPDGGTEAKPVGTVWIALATPKTTTARRFQFPGDRETVRDRAAKSALMWLRYELLGISA